MFKNFKTLNFKVTYRKIQTSSSWSRIVAEDRGGGKNPMFFPPPCTYPSNFQNIGRMMMKLFFCKELCISDLLTTYLIVIRPKTYFLETLKKIFSSKTAKIATFCDFRFYLDFPLFAEKIKNSFFQGGSNLHIFLSFYRSNTIRSALEPP